MIEMDVKVNLDVSCILFLWGIVGTILKLTGIIGISWWLIWIPFGACIIFMIVILLIALGIIHHYTKW